MVKVFNVTYNAAKTFAQIDINTETCHCGSCC